jgi:hypothetical protein
MATITNTANPELSGYLNRAETKQVNSVVDVLTELIQIRRASEDKETQLKLKLKELLKPAYFKANTDAEEAADVNHTFDVGDLQVNFTNSYFIKDNQHMQQLVKLLGANHPLIESLKQQTKIVIDVTNLSEQDANKLAKDVTADAVSYGVRPEVERKGFATKEFHDLRHVYLSPEDNIELDKDLPLVIQVAPIE